MRNPTAPILLAEEGPGISASIAAAIRAEGIPNPVHVVADYSDFKTYLSRTMAASQRTEFHRPALLLFEIHDSGQSIPAMLGWRANHREYLHIPAVVLCPAAQVEAIRRAYDLRANSVLARLAETTALRSTIGAVSRYWLTLNENPPDD